MTAHEREEFWKRIYPLVEGFAEEASGCDAMVNRFERRRWDLKFTRRRAGDSPSRTRGRVPDPALLLRPCGGPPEQDLAASASRASHL